MISTNFPKKDIVDMVSTIEQSGLVPHAAVFVHDLNA